MYSDPISYEDAVLVPLGLRPQPIAWRAVIKAIYGSVLTDDELEIFRRLSGGIDPPPGGSKRVLLVFGRRSGKSTAAARIAWFEATQRDHYRYLEPGQIGSVSVVAQDLAGASQVVNYTQGLAALPSLKRKHVAKIPVETIDLKNGLRVEKVTASEQAVRSRTAITVIADEIGYWDQTGPDEDRKVMAALTPSLLASSDAPPRRLIALTSAGYQRGWAYETYVRDYGRPAPWLVLQGSTIDLRPDIDVEEIDADCAGDPHKRAREYFSVWRDATASGFFDSTSLDACVSPSIALATPTAGVRYHVAIDPSFERDLFAVAVACSTNELIQGDVQQNRVRHTSVVHVDAWQPKPGQPISPTEAARRVAAICRRYGSNTVYSDQHAAVPLAEAFRAHGIKLVKRPWHSGHDETSKASRFQAVRDAMHNGAFTLPNDPDLIRELQAINYAPLPNGGIRIEGKSKNDDRAHAAVLAASEALLNRPSVRETTLTPWELSQRSARRASIGRAFGYAGNLLLIR